MFALIDEYTTFESRLNLSTPWRDDTTHLDATVDSIAHRLLKFLDEKMVSKFVGELKERLVKADTLTMITRGF